jgi:hypothetical protein
VQDRETLKGCQYISFSRLDWQAAHRYHNFSNERSKINNDDFCERRGGQTSARIARA